ncbi:alpha/beta hydrolase [Pedobacter changchengzhani]|uniref:Alpha/beta hydrolase n=1 Tax=Pedobacter changchengzhani TaxID=2529274 RepID=A0A4R5MLQ0_9SPHI|nr:alpha/beta hydrolase [Pedobacter changchengzhani]TDG36029.1 alpha/beta hydrolase [Pedobacter changchengzhani]
MYKKILFIILLFPFLVTSAQVKTAKNLNYLGNDEVSNTLNIYYKNDSIKNKPVIIFIHGGSWSTGKKETYWWLGRNFARKGVVTVIINYPLAPNAGYEKMATDCASAVKWVQENIANYKGSGEKIFLMGHSAGAHLAELINADPKYFKNIGIKNPVKGVILNDPFGLDMYEYLTKAEKDDSYTNFLRTFTNDPANWKKGSPLTYVDNIKNPHLLFYGAKTYDAIKIQTPRLNQILKANHVPSEIVEVKGKSHVPMITQMIFGCNKLYAKIVSFVNE